MSEAALKSAPARAECTISLAAFRHNVHRIASELHTSTQLWAVVKADAYGHGVQEIAQAAIAAGAKRLCVATLSEARQLRNIGIRVPLLIMGPLDAIGMQRAVDLNVSITIVNESMLAELSSVHSESSSGIARVHLKVDTGMGRWGIPLSEVMSAVDTIDRCPGVELEGIMTHFATADEGDSFFKQQLQLFSEVVASVRAVRPNVIAHAANSAATLRSAESHFDAVRCGVALYGLDPMQRDAARLDLQPVMQLTSYVAGIRDRSPGESVGYSRTFIADSESKVAIVPIGYADGVRRTLANVGKVNIGGELLPIVGNVSMDQIAVLINDSVAVGDIVHIIGGEGAQAVTAEDHAQWATTINYEITCNVANEPRLTRTVITDQ